MSVAFLLLPTHSSSDEHSSPLYSEHDFMFSLVQHIVFPIPQKKF